MISVLIPTLGRPERLTHAVFSALKLAEQEVEVLVRVADEDLVADVYMAMAWPREVTLHRIGNCFSYGKGIEALQMRARGDILFAGADDAVFRTPHWDAVVKAQFATWPDGIGIAYANNGLDREKCEHFFTTRRWIDVVGYMVWTEFRHFCVDQWVEELATALGRLAFLRGVTVEHMHKKYVKAPNDATYDMVRGQTRTSELDNELFAQRGPERAAALERLRAVVGHGD